MSAVTFMGADHHQMEAFLFRGSAEICTQFNAIQGCRAGSPSTLTITNSTAGWTAPRIKVSPTMLEREEKWFPFSHSQQLTSLPSVPIIHLLLRLLSKMLAGVTIFHYIAAVSDTLSNNYSCWFLQHFCFTMLFKAQSPCWSRGCPRMQLFHETHCLRSWSSSCNWKCSQGKSKEPVPAYQVLQFWNKASNPGPEEGHKTDFFC